MISISNLGKMYGDRTLFAGVSMRLTEGKRYGLVGANGSGKTTLLNILTGDLEASSGKVAIPRRLRLGVLRQDQFLYEDEKILNVAIMGNAELWKVMVAKDKILTQAKEHFDADKFSALEETFLRYDGYTAEARAGAVLEGLGLPAAIHHDPLSTLSGGFKLRVLLAQVLAGNPDVLLLDEPTNHLDIESRNALIEALCSYSGAVVLVTHDAHLVNLLADRLWLVADGTCGVFDGDIEDYRRSLFADRSALDGGTRHNKSGNARREARRTAAKSREASASLRRTAKSAECDVERLSSELSRISDKLTKPEAYTESSGELEALLKLRGSIEKELKAAEEHWLASQEALDNR